MELLTSTYHILLIILGFELLVFVHELGHFIAARWAGIRAEAFAIGMGPVVFAYRKGIGLRFRSTTPEYEQRIAEYLKREADVQINFKDQTTSQRVSAEQRERAEKALGFGETEYSFRWLPIGGFVKMLGQDDADPTYVSDDPRSYNRCPIGKRMVVVSAGVLSNLVLATILFIAAFMIGVRFEAPAVGAVSRSLPAGSVVAENASDLGISTPGLMPGDEITQIDGDPVSTFADIQIASAMSRPGQTLTLMVRRPGIDAPLTFRITPAKDEISGLLSLGIAPGSSTTLLADDAQGELTKALARAGLAQQGVKPRMRLLTVEGTPVGALSAIDDPVRASGGRPLASTWSAVDENGEPTGAAIGATIESRPAYQPLVHRGLSNDDPRAEHGLMGLSPLARIAEVVDPLNAALVRPGDVLLRVGTVDFPRMMDVSDIVKAKAGGIVPLRVLRDGRPVEVMAKVSRQGQIGITLTLAEDVPVTAQPLLAVLEQGEDKRYSRARPTPLAVQAPLPGTRITAVNGTPVSDWPQFRSALRQHVEAAAGRHEGAEIVLGVVYPTPGEPGGTFRVSLSPRDVADIHELSWVSRLDPDWFESLQTLRSAGGNPVLAVRMGFEETRKLMVLTYLTIDRLFRGSVGVEQLRGPVGIVHIGAKVAERGYTYLLFFLAMISVNLAVINFLPLPIVDGGLFLFLVYEKFKGRPPPLAFQNAATIVGLCMIGTIFLVTFYNDIARLIR